MGPLQAPPSRGGKGRGRGQVRAHPRPTPPTPPPPPTSRPRARAEPWPALPFEHLRWPPGREPPPLPAAAAPCPRCFESPRAALHCSPACQSPARPRPYSPAFSRALGGSAPSLRTPLPPAAWSRPSTLFVGGAFSSPVPSPDRSPTQVKPALLDDSLVVAPPLTGAGRPSALWLDATDGETRGNAGRDAYYWGAS